MAKPFITIIGLGETGRKVGLALRAQPGDFDVVGHDKNKDADAEARRLNAVNRTEWNLHRAVEGSSVVVLAIPLAEVEPTLTHISESIAPNSLVLVLSSLLQPITGAAARAMPNHDRVVAAHLIQGPVSSDSGTFHRSTAAIAAPPSTSPNALELASDFAERIGAAPHFMDPIEHDGIMALVDQLPLITGAALVNLSASSPGWNESKRLAGRQFAQSTDIGSNAEQLFTAFISNRENLVRRLEQVQGDLARWLSLLQTDPAEGEEHPMLTVLKSAVNERELWQASAESGQWDETTDTSSESTSSMLRQMFLGNFGRRRPPEPPTSR
jgi:prephenate dehydrogenase